MATKVNDFLKANPNYIGYANKANRTTPQTAKTNSKKGSGRLGKNGLSAWISELGGSGGALAGAATGAALGSVVPGIGNIVGGIAGGVIGGFAGGTGGRLAENQLRDNEYRLGDALKEGAVSGAFGAVGPSWQAARGLGALGKAGGSVGIRGGASLLSNMSDDAAKVAGKAIVSKGSKAGKAIGQGITNVDDLAYATRKGLQSAGGSLRSINRGMVAGNSGLSPDDVIRQNKALDGVNKWFSGIGKSAQYTNADDALKALSNTYKMSGEGAVKFGKSNSDDLLNRFIKNLDDNPVLKGNLTKQNSKIVSNLGDDIANFSGKNNSDFIEYMSKKINPRYRTISASGAAGSKESQILEAFRDAGKSLIDEKMATRSGINKQFSNLMGATSSLGKTITRDAGAGAGQGLTLGRILGNAAGAGMDVGGRGMQQIGKVTKVTTPLAIGAVARGAANQAMAPVVQNPTEEQQPTGQIVEGGVLTPDALYGSTAMNQDPVQMTGQETPQQSAYTLQQALAEAYQLAPNASESELLSYAKALQAESKGTQLSAQEKKAQKQAETALQGLTQLKQLFSSAGGGQNRLPGILGNIQGTVGANSQAEAYNKIRDSLTTSLARAFGETGVLTDQDREVYKQALPRLEDTPEEAQIKLQYLEDMLAGSSQSYGETDYGTQADLSSIISQYEGM